MKINQLKRDQSAVPFSLVRQPNPLICLENIEVSFNQNKVLDNINLKNAH